MKPGWLQQQHQQQVDEAITQAQAKHSTYQFTPTTAPAALAKFLRGGGGGGGIGKRPTLLAFQQDQQAQPKQKAKRKLHKQKQKQKQLQQQQQQQQQQFEEPPTERSIPPEAPPYPSYADDGGLGSGLTASFPFANNGNSGSGGQAAATISGGEQDIARRIAALRVWVQERTHN